MKNTAAMTVATIPAKHTAHTLLGTIRWLRADPENRRVLPLIWTADPAGMTYEQFMAWFRECLDRKITARMDSAQPGPPRGA